MCKPAFVWTSVVPLLEQSHTFPVEFLVKFYIDLSTAYLTVLLVMCGCVGMKLSIDVMGW